MAFIRWRGNSAQLLTTIYEHGRSRQLHLATLGGAYTVAPEVRETVTARFPAIQVDWDAVEKTLTEGPPHERAQTAAGMPNERLEWLEIERRLRYWAVMAEPLRPEQARCLRAAAGILAEWRLGNPAFPLAQPLPGWDEALAGPTAAGATSEGPGKDT